MIMMEGTGATEPVLLVTGAASGLGKAIMELFADDGYAVVGLDRQVTTLQTVVDSLRNRGAIAIALPADVSREQDVFASVQQVQQRFGRLDVVVNSAGIDVTAPIEDLAVADWDRVIAVNLRGPFLLAKAVFSIMREQGGGHIVNIASTAALRAWAHATAYHASKWGLLGFSRGLGVEGRPYGIRVTTVIPGGMRTAFFDRFLEQGIPLPDPRTLQEPEAVARVVLWAVKQPSGSVVQEVLVTPLHETSWP